MRSWKWPRVIAHYRCSGCGQHRLDGVCACAPDEPPLVTMDYVPVSEARVVEQQRDEARAALTAMLDATAPWTDTAAPCEEMDGVWHAHWVRLMAARYAAEQLTQETP